MTQRFSHNMRMVIVCILPKNLDFWKNSTYDSLRCDPQNDVQCLNLFILQFSRWATSKWLKQNNSFDLRLQIKLRLIF